jgi:hypothetical protein
MPIALQVTEEQIFQSGHAGLACGEESWHKEFNYCEFKTENAFLKSHLCSTTMYPHLKNGIFLF